MLRQVAEKSCWEKLVRQVGAKSWREKLVGRWVRHVAEKSWRKSWREKWVRKVAQKSRWEKLGRFFFETKKTWGQKPESKEQAKKASAKKNFVKSRNLKRKGQSQKKKNESVALKKFFVFFVARGKRKGTRAAPKIFQTSLEKTKHVLERCCENLCTDWC